MKPVLWSFLLLPLTAAAEGDPRLTSWLTAPSAQYARIYETDATKASGSSVTTWSRRRGVQATPTYAGVMQVLSSDDWVYMRSTGLGYHVMGPWYLNPARTRDFPNFPASRNTLYRIPRTPIVPETKTLTRPGPIGYGVDGVALFDFTDTFSYSTANRKDAEPPNGLRGDSIWNRDAYVNEGVTFDAANAHQAGPTYHYHANMPALRHLLGDHVDFNTATKSYVESATTPVHSPIVGWMSDGHPVYGPYGYAAADDATSTVRRMISGYVKRDGSHGSTDLFTTGRTTLPKWATTAQQRPAHLASSVHGPDVNSAYVLGHYLEDYDYLGDLDGTLGADFDLDLYNGRTCVTPEFPGGTYAYFVSIEPDGTPKFPYMIARWFHGRPTGGPAQTIEEPVTEFVRAGPRTTPQLRAAANSVGVALTWSSVEGATYQIESSNDGTVWATLATAVTSSGSATSYTAAETAKHFRVTMKAIATYDSRTSGDAALGTMATVDFVTDLAHP